MSSKNSIIPQELGSLVIHLNQLVSQLDILLLRPQETEPSGWWILGREIQNELFNKATSLFSPDGFPDNAHHSLETYNTGVVPQSKLTEAFGKLKLDYQPTINYLISLEFGAEISDETAEVIGFKSSKNEGKLYFFPGLIKTMKDDQKIEENTKEGYVTSGLLVENSKSWGLLFLHGLLLRLTYKFAVEKDQYYNRRIYLWKNGLQTFTESLIEVILELKHDKVICILLRCRQEISSKIKMARVRHTILEVIHSLSKKTSPADSTELESVSKYIVYPHPQSFSSMEDHKKIPLAEILNILKKPLKDRAYFLSDVEPHCLQDIFHFEPYAFVESTEVAKNVMDVKITEHLRKIPELKAIEDISYKKLQEILQIYSVYSTNDLRPIFEHFFKR